LQACRLAGLQACRYTYSYFMGYHRA
jgi:hypothetical protein